jgi:hypothetical protein
VKWGASHDLPWFTSGIANTPFGFAVAIFIGSWRFQEPSLSREVLYYLPAEPPGPGGMETFI